MGNGSSESLICNLSTLAVKLLKKQKFYGIIRKSMVERKKYLEKLELFKDKKIIKIITGIRRCGKSTLLRQFSDKLKQNGVQENQIIFINLESAKYDDITEYHKLYELVESKIQQNSNSSDKIHYVFIDEIQNVENFEKAVNSLTVDFNIDLYLTGSNAKMLSSEIATILSGRYIEIKMQPFSFCEYLECRKTENKIQNTNEDEFYNFLKYGSFPFIASENDENVISNYLDGIYSTVVLKDVIARNSVKDVNLLQNILKTTLSSIGSYVSPNSISKALKNEKKNVTNETVERYLEMFCDAFILSKAERFDIRGKEYLKTMNKYYVVDLGLRNSILGFRQIEMTHALENAVYFELLRRGFKVDIGKIDSNEVDFIARKNDKIQYYQVSFSVNKSDETLQREIRPFNSIKDHYEKILITMDKDFVNDINGVKKINAVEWFLEE